jgi:dTDP-N-acetylfucosamine:lipid II N-acetylfucosaminyltransferase
VISKDLRPIIHVATDEKFIDAAYNIYTKAFPGMNMFLILQGERNENILYLNQTDKYVFVKISADFVDVVEDYCKDAKIIVFHGINYNQAILANKLSKHSKKYVWSVFGAEVYNNNLIVKNESVGSKTYWTFVFSFKKLLKDIFRSVYFMLVKGKESPNKTVKKSFLKMDFVSILYEEEFKNYFKLGILNSNVKHLKFTYYPLELVINNNIGFVEGTNILLGNSASYTNNHLEAFEFIEKFDIRKFDILSPLSYGNKKYADEIIELGKLKFGDRFCPLTKYMPLIEYQNILKSCGIVIMNHYRQQAVGNVMNAVFLGAKVFLSERNTLFHYLKRIGCYVYSIENDFANDNNEILSLLTSEQMIHNRGAVSIDLALDTVIRELQTKLNPILIESTL